MSRRKRVAWALAALVATSLPTAGCNDPSDRTSAGPVSVVGATRSDEPLTNVTVGRITRSAVTLRTGGPASTEFAASGVVAGALDLFVARRSGERRRATVTATMQCRDWMWMLRRRQAPACRVAWAPGTVSRRWRRCRIHVPAECGDASIRIDAQGAAESDIVASMPVLPLRPRPDAPNVFFFMLDTVRADRLRPFTKGAPVGRYMSRLGRRSLVFPRARSVTSWTRPAVASMLTGLKADAHGTHNRPDVLSERIGRLPQWLAEHGFHTAAFSTNPNILPAWGFDLGFDEFHDVNSGEWAHLKPEAEDIVDRLIENVQANAGRAGFYYVHLNDAHHPYRPPAQGRARVNAIVDIHQTFPRQPLSKDQGLDLNAYFDYLGELVDMDAQIGRFTRFLRDSGRMRTSTIVVVSDHGEEFLDHGMRYHGTTLFEEVLRAVLLIKAPAAAAVRGTVSAAVGIEDIAPTVLTLLGMQPPVPVDGRSLVEPRAAATAAPAGRLQPAAWLKEPPRPRFATLKLDQARISAVIVEPWKLIQYHHADSTLLYNLVADPHERQNLADLNIAKVEELRAVLAAEAARYEAGWHVLACGGRNDRGIAMRIAAGPGTVTTRFLESDDRADPAGSGEVVLQLQAIEREVEQLGRMLVRREQDRDEILLAAGDDSTPPPVLTAMTAAPLRYTVGSDRSIVEAATIDLSMMSEQATIHGAEWVECPLSQTDLSGEPVAMEERPYLRIWRVPGTRAVAEESVDPKISERLRGLGYAW